MPAPKMQKEACAGAWHRLPFGRECRRKGRQFLLHSRNPLRRGRGETNGRKTQYKRDNELADDAPDEGKELPDRNPKELER